MQDMRGKQNYRWCGEDIYIPQGRAVHQIEEGGALRE
jgi:hypothetical protein